MHFALRSRIAEFETAEDWRRHRKATPVNTELSVALHLKFLRVQSGMTLEDLARDSGLTRSYLSKVERGISTPSIESAFAISKALGVTVDRLFGQHAEDDPVTIVRGNGHIAGDLSTHLSLVAGLKDNRAMRAFVVRPGKTQRRGRIMSHHEGEELLFILTGQIEMQIGARKEILNPGDCVQFDSTIPHKLIALTDETASALVVVAATA
ncbi:XRE family transcriptional regulator [Comamonas sp.]|uniref:helix-turn-helix domain-containing protein n=1 Tax=Comamonas sp. TaxID=34028 RepID=UPI00289ADE1C|nr:XRE family transcriptional regulator [Comamonas sp.]